MSKFISNLAVAEYDKEVKREYAQNPQMKGLVRVKSGVTGTTCRFQKSAQGQALCGNPDSLLVFIRDYRHILLVVLKIS